MAASCQLALWGYMVRCIGFSRDSDQGSKLVDRVRGQSQQRLPETKIGNPILSAKCMGGEDPISPMISAVFSVFSKKRLFSLLYFSIIIPKCGDFSSPEICFVGIGSEAAGISLYGLMTERR